MELPEGTVNTIAPIEKRSKWRNIGDKIKRIAYILIALINTLIPALISLGVLTIASPIVMISAGICTVALLIASKSEDLERLIEKYGLNNDRIVIKLDDLKEMGNDLHSIKNIIKSSQGSLSARSINPHEPISTSARTEIKTKTPRVKAWYNKELDIIEMEYIEPQTTPR